MDLLKKLELEFGGIESVITQYSSKGNIGNFVDGLGKGISDRDIESIKYYLEQIR